MTPEVSAPRIQEMPRSRAKLFVRHAPAEHHGFLLSKIGYQPSRLFQAIEAMDPDTGRLWGMVGYDWFTKNSVQMHVLLSQPIVARTLLRPAFEYAFSPKYLGKKLALGIVSSENKKALDFDTSMGFREVYRVRDGISDGVDNVLLEMRREECRWWKA